MYNLYKRNYWSCFYSFIGLMLSIILLNGIVDPPFNASRKGVVVLILFVLMMVFDYEIGNCYCKKMNLYSSFSLIVLGGIFLLFYNPICLMPFVLLNYGPNLLYLYIIPLPLFFVDRETV
ncbi:hypothetical protein LJT99_15800 [Lentisphaerae bacterium WC36]|nr:hypothetical protein LJT99_15800 [Lentisphaerae bacterium WC36]